MKAKNHRLTRAIITLSLGLASLLAAHASEEGDRSVARCNYAGAPDYPCNPNMLNWAVFADEGYYKDGTKECGKILGGMMKCNYIYRETKVE